MKDFIKAVSVGTLIGILAGLLSNGHYYSDELRMLKDQNDVLQGEIAELTELNKSLAGQYVEVKSQIDSIRQDQKQLRQRTDFLDRAGDRPEKQNMRITAYDLSFKSCGKLPGHPAYGITASGEPARDWYTVAAGTDIPFGTKIYIPYFKDKPNRGLFVVQDRGGGIKAGEIDVFMRNGADCMKFGVRNLDVWVFKNGV
jgi:3D (Asp-Asp-Asp) domain-containing protein